MLLPALQGCSASADVEPPWPRGEWAAATPRSQQIDTSALEQLDRDITSGKHGYADSIPLYRNGYVVYETSYAHDYKRAGGCKYTVPCAT